MQASSSTAATTAAAIAAVESVSECFVVCVTDRPTIVVVVGLTAELGVVSVGTVALTGVVVTGGTVVVGCTLADAGTGKVGVELVLTTICLCNANRTRGLHRPFGPHGPRGLYCPPAYSRSSIAASASRSTSA